MGFYADENLNVEFVAARGGVDVAKQIGSGNAMVGGAIGDTPIIVRANGIPVKAVAVLGAGALTMVAGSEDAGVKSIADLKGKTVTVLSYADTTYYALLAALRKAGLNRDDLDIQAAGPAGVWKLFSSGESQGMAGVADWIVNSEETGLKVNIIPEEEMAVSMAQAIIASEDAIENHPELVQSLVTATLKGMQAIIADPKAAATAFAKAVPAYAGKEASLEKIFNLYITRVYKNQSPLGMIDVDRLSQVNHYYASEGIVSIEAPVEELYDSRFVVGAESALKSK